MDPGTLLVSATSLARSLNGTSTTPQSLERLSTAVQAVEARTQRIQEWMHFTDASSKMQVMHSLLDAMKTVNLAMQRLQGDMDDILVAATAPHRSQDSQASPANDEAHVKVHSVDIGQCASLLQFTLTVCQLPLGYAAQMELEELVAGARTLRRAQTSSRLERAELIRSLNTDSKSLSDHYRTFLGQLLEAEQDLPTVNVAYSRTRQPNTSSATSTSTSAIQLRLDTTIQDSPQPVAGRPESQKTSPVEGGGVGMAVSTPLDEAVPATAFTPVSIMGESLASSMNSSPTAPPTYFSTRRNVSTDVKQPAPLSHFQAPQRTPPLPPKSPARDRDIARAAGSTSQPQNRSAVKRKPVLYGAPDNAAASGSRPPIPSAALPYHTKNRSASVSPQDSAYSLMEKVNPITQSLSSLSEGEYLNVEFEQPPAQPHADDPPMYSRSPLYSQVSGAVEALSQLETSENSSRTSAPTLRITTKPTTTDDRSPLILSLAREDCISDLLEVIKQGYNVDETDARTGKTAIMEAAKWRRFDSCQLLLKAGARLHWKDVNGETVLHHAAREGDADICQILLAAGALSEDCNRKGETPLGLAAAGGHGQAVLRLIDGVESRRPNDPAMIKAFLQAVKLGDVVMAQMFLARDVKPKKLKDSWKPIAYAAQSGSLPMLDLVMHEKCSLKDKSPDGWTALHFAAKYGQQPMAEKLLSLRLKPTAETKNLEETPLHLAAAAGHTATAVAILQSKDSGATIKDKDNQEPIHHAVRNGDTKLTAALMDKGAKLSNATKYGWKPVHLAAANGHVALLAECMTRGISIEEKLQPPSFRPEKRTNAAARRGYWAEIRWPHTGARPLHLAIEFGHDDAAHMLISGGCKIDESDSRGWRPIHYAAFHCRAEVLHTLLNRGATVDAKTVDGYTAAALGFREYGLAADREQRGRVQEMLHQAMLAQRKSKLKAMADFRWQTGNAGPSKTAAQRNLAWHNAQLAESLYASGDANDGEDDESILTDGTGVGVGPSTTSLAPTEAVSQAVYGDGVPGGSSLGLGKG